MKQPHCKWQWRNVIKTPFCIKRYYFFLFLKDDTNIMNNSKMFPLTATLDIVKILVENGADVNGLNKRRDTPVSNQNNNTL